jgi:hypothetical protein
MMQRFFTFTIAAGIAATIPANAWSQAGGAGAGSAFDQTTWQNGAGSAFDQTTWQNGAGSAFDQTTWQNRRNGTAAGAGSAFDQTTWQTGSNQAGNFTFDGINQTPFFIDPAVSQLLNLTREQRQQLRRLSRQWQQQIQRFQRKSNYNINEQQWAQFCARYAQQLNALFTPQQLYLWAQLSGQQDDLPAITYFPIQRQAAGRGGLNSRRAGPK